MVERISWLLLRDKFTREAAGGWKQKSQISTNNSLSRRKTTKIDGIGVPEDGLEDTICVKRAPDWQPWRNYATFFLPQVLAVSVGEMRSAGASTGPDFLNFSFDWSTFLVADPSPIARKTSNSECRRHP